MSPSPEQRLARHRRLAERLAPVVSRGVLQQFFVAPQLPQSPLTPAALRRAWAAYAREVAQARAPDRLSLYLHIPFCSHRCRYCIYHSHGDASPQDVERYVARLEAELDYYGAPLRNVPVSAEYVGGGTPTVLSTAQLARILEARAARFRFRPGGERSFECNPLTATADKARLFADHGFNRVSFGIQTLDPTVLARVNRGYQTEARVFDTLRRMQRERFWVNVDLIHGLPGESLDDLCHTVDRLLEAEVTSIKVYLLSPFTPPGVADPTTLTLTAPALAERLAPVAARHGGRARASSTSVSVRPSDAVLTQNRLWEDQAAAGAIRRYDDTAVEPGSLLGLGPTARSTIYGQLRYTQDRWPVDAPLAPDVPCATGRRLDRMEEQRRFAVYHLERPEGLSRAGFEAVFGEAPEGPLGEDLAALETLGLAEATATGWTLVPEDPAERFAATLFLVDPAMLDFVERPRADPAPDSGPPPSAREPWIAGPRARSRLARRLRLRTRDPSGAHWFLERAEGHGPERIRFRLAKGERRFAFHLKDARDEGVYLRTSCLGLCVEADRVGPSADAFLRRVARRLEGVSLADLFEDLRLDRRTAPEPPPTPAAPAPAEPCRDPRLGYLGGPFSPRRPGWRLFLADEDFRHDRGDPILQDEGWVVLEHGDRECFHSHNWPDPSRYPFLNDPRAPLPARGWRDQRMRVQHLVSELDEQDAIRGGGARLDQLVERAIAAPAPDLYVLNHLCTPVVVGDDLAAAATRLAEATDQPVFEITRHTKVTQTLVERLFDAVAGDAPPALLSPSVNLLGLPRRYREEELAPFLADLGRAVNVSLLPELHGDGLRQLGRATWHLRWRPSPFDAALAQILSRVQGEVITVAPPFGPHAARASLARVADVLGCADRFTAAWEARWSPVRARWERARAAVRGQRLGFVLDRAEWCQMRAEGHLEVPMVDVLLEMGFGLEVWVHGAPAGGAPAPDDPVVVRPFETEADLRRGLRASPCAAFYSDIYADHRLPRAGKAQFSRRHFEPGARGAVRTLESLAALCDLPFYRRYARFLKGNA